MVWPPGQSRSAGAPKKPRNFLEKYFFAICYWWQFCPHSTAFQDRYIVSACLSLIRLLFTFRYYDCPRKFTPGIIFSHMKRIKCNNERKNTWMNMHRKWRKAREFQHRDTCCNQNINGVCIVLCCLNDSNFDDVNNCLIINLKIFGIRLEPIHSFVWLSLLSNGWTAALTKNSLVEGVRMRSDRLKTELSSIVAQCEHTALNWVSQFTSLSFVLTVTRQVIMSALRSTDVCFGLDKMTTQLTNVYRWK